MEYIIQLHPAIAYRRLREAHFIQIAVTAAVLLFATTVCSGQPKKDSTIRGAKQYELTNHLGNVLATVSDRRMQTNAPPAGASGLAADLLSATDYYAFGMQIPGRSYSSSIYRYGFNGKEQDNELNVVGGSYDFGARINDTRLGRWLSIDPHTKRYPGISGYSAVINNPINVIDPDGKDIIVLAHGNRNDDPSARHLPGHQAVLIGNDKTGWTFMSYDYDKGENKGSGANSKNNIYTIQTFDKLEQFKNSEYNTFKDDYDDGKGLETSHRGKKGNILQRFDNAYQITTTPSQDADMIEGGKKTFEKPYGVVSGNQCTRVATNALDAGNLKNGETTYLTIFGVPYAEEENFFPAAKQEAIEQKNKGTDVDEKIKMTDN